MQQIVDIGKELAHNFQMRKPVGWISMAPFDAETIENFCKALAHGLIHTIAMRMKPGQDTYRTIHDNQDVLVDLECRIEDKEFDWVVFNGVNLRSRPYLDTATGINPTWIMNHPHLQQERMPKSGAKGDGPVRQREINSTLQALRDT
ncbi:hypothetical protein GGR58DRAFT_29690 [Xylaria digitata]|nr:hypothetical protein GGR58DRAFT_29690 [Xylaria digitata]